MTKSPTLQSVAPWRSASRFTPVITWCLAAWISSCATLCAPSHSNMSPEDVVQAYLDIALNMSDVSQRKTLMGYTTGNLKAAIAGATDETIRAAYVDKRYELISYAVVERRDKTPRETEITFQLSYRDLGNNQERIKPEEAAKVTTENTVVVARENKLWLIRDVVGQKTEIDFPIAAAARIEAKPGDFNPPPPDEPEEVPAPDAP